MKLFNSTSRHLKGLYITPELIAQIFFQRDDPNVIDLPCLKLPEGTAVRSVNYVSERQAFLMVLEHPSFEEVYEGSVIPIVNPHTKKVTLVVKDD